MAQHMEASVPSLPGQLAIPSAVEAIVRRAMAKKPDDRFDNADAMADALLSFIAEGHSREPQTETHDTGESDSKTITLIQPTLEVLTEFIREYPDNPDWLYRRGSAYMDTGEYQNAVDDYSELIRLRPGDNHAFRGRGQAYGKLDRYTRASDDFTNAIRLQPNDPDAGGAE